MNGPCPEMQDRIADYVLGALDTEQAEALQKHLDGCEACRRYAQSLQDETQSLVALGRQFDADMGARRDKVIEALQDISPVQTDTLRLFPPVGGFLRMSVAAVLVLGAGVLIGRSTAPRPVDVEQLRTDLQASLVASLKPAVQENVLAEVDRRLESGLAANEASLRDQLAEQLRGDLQLFATQFTAGSEQRLEKRLAEFIQLIEEARLKDRLHVVRALEQMEQNRYRDRTQIQTSLAALIDKKPTAIQQLGTSERAVP
ncbi:MAG: zf-HC2 domain-containing protein [Planctomycetes bacterium]|nr:zf-HC2 domain-containing protein [Planctomycetota bacterium]